jgi:hypothetical protein
MHQPTDQPHKSSFVNPVHINDGFGEGKQLAAYVEGANPAPLFCQPRLHQARV